jgi:hypothetical protein
MIFKSFAKKFNLEFKVEVNNFPTQLISVIARKLFSKNIMTSPRLPLVKAQWSFLSGIRLSREQHGPKVKVTAPPIKKRKFGTLGVLPLSLSKKDVRPCTCLYIDSKFTWIVTRPCG